MSENEDEFAWIGDVLADPVLFAQVFFQFDDYIGKDGQTRSGPYDYQVEYWRASGKHDPAMCIPAHTDVCDGTPHKRIFLLWGRQSGKTTSVAIKKIWKCLTNPGTLLNPYQVLITSVGINNSMVMFRKIRDLVDSNPLLSSAVIGPDPHGRATRTEIWFSNRTRIAVRALGHTGAAAKGLTVNDLTGDEAAYIKEDHFNVTLFPTLAATNGDLELLTTPFGKDHFSYRCYTNRKYWVAKVRSRDCPKISNEILEEAKGLVGPLAFRQEYDVEFLDEESAWFPTKLLRERVTGDFSLISEGDVLLGKTHAGEYLIGADFGKRGSHTAIAVYSIIRRADGATEVRLTYEKQFPLVGEKSGEDDIFRQATEHILACGRTFNLVRGCLDSSNNESIVEQIRASLPQLEGVNLSESKVADVMSHARNMMEQGRVKIPYYSPTVNELSAQSYEVREKGRLGFPKPEHGATNDRLWATILALYAIRQPVTEGYVRRI